MGSCGKLGLKWTIEGEVSWGRGCRALVWSLDRSTGLPETQNVCHLQLEWDRFLSHRLGQRGGGKAQDRPTAAGQCSGFCQAVSPALWGSVILYLIL